MNPPRGMRDILPADKARRERVLSVIRGRYRSHGFDEIETPVVEDYDRLHAGIGGDNEKLSYNVLRRGLDADAIREAADDPAALASEAELGDALLALVALARSEGWDAERALRQRLRTLADAVRAAESS